MKIKWSMAILALTYSCGIFDGKNTDETSQQSGNDSTDNIPGETRDSFGGKIAIPHSPLQLQGNLVKPSSCQEVVDYIQNIQIAQLRRYYEDQLKYFSDGGFSRNEVMKTESAEVAADGASDTISTAAPTEYTTTNTQVEGVDEADFIKNNGTNIFAIRGSELHILKSWPADEMASISVTELDDKPLEMMLDENNRLIIAARPKIKAKVVQDQQKDQIAADAAAPAYYWNYDYNSVRLIIVDVSNTSKPEIIGKYLYQGNYNTLRRVGNSVRLVVNSYLGYMWRGMDYVHAYEYTDKEQLNIALEKSFTKNVEEIKKYSIDDYLNYNRSYYDFYELEDESGQLSFVKEDCGNIFLPTTPAELGLTMIATLNLDKKSSSETILLAQSGTVYASKESLYIANPYWWWWSSGPENTDSDYTFIHKFDIKDPESATYMGSGRIAGTINNQFSMDEFAGNLRVATTVSQYEEPQSNAEIFWRNFNTYNQVVVLGQGDQQLDLIGETEKLAEGERIYSARFAQERGFVVTFRQVDPLFTLDLSDPKKPKVLGELKIPGFSEYMQLIDENHLLTVGQGADPETGRVEGVKVSLFDVSDMTNPQELDNYLVSIDGWSYSEANYNHKAFTYFAAKKLLGIPVSGYSYNNNSSFNSLMVFDIDLEAGISKRGEVDLKGLYGGKDNGAYWWYGYNNVRRSIFADDFVYAISNAGVKVVNIDDLDNTVATVVFECDEFCYNYDWY